MINGDGDQRGPCGGNLFRQSLAFVKRVYKLLQSENNVELSLSDLLLLACPLCVVKLRQGSHFITCNDTYYSLQPHDHFGCRAIRSGVWWDSQVGLCCL